MQARYLAVSEPSRVVYPFDSELFRFGTVGNNCEGEHVRTGISVALYSGAGSGCTPWSSPVICMISPRRIYAGFLL
jgi:hypothetical protein